MLQPTISSLQLDRYFLKSLNFRLHEGFDRRRVPNSELTVPNLEVGVVAVDQNPDNELQWRFELKLELLDPKEGEKVPYKVEATVVGYFTVSDQYSIEEAERLAKTNGPAVLYSSARELLAVVTGRSMYPPVLIPSVTFIQPHKAVAAQVESPQTRKALPAGSKAEGKNVSKKRETRKGTKKAAK